jgi:hypothetical protein
MSTSRRRWSDRDELLAEWAALTAQARRPATVRPRPFASFAWLAPVAAGVVLVAVLGVLVFSGPPGPGQPTTVPSITPSPTASASSATTPQPSASASAGPTLEWTKVTKTGEADGLLRDGDAITGLVALGGGYVMAGDAGNGASAVIWHSADGVSWQRIEDGPAFAESEMTGESLVPVAGGVLAVGSSIQNDPTCRGGEGSDCNGFDPIRLWFTPDGATWTLLPDTATVPFGRSMLAMVAAGPGGLVAFGYRIPIHGSTFPPAVWTSPDGRTWTAAPQFGQAFPLGVVDRLIGWRDGYVAFGRNTGLDKPHSGPATAWFSQDGRTWTAAVVPPSTDEIIGRLWAGSHGLLAGGPTGGGPEAAVYWTSGNGQSWQVAAESSFPFVTTNTTPLLLADGANILALGTDRSGAFGGWLSSDGTKWQSIAQAGSLPVLAQSGGNQGVLGPAGAVVAAEYSGSFASTLWTADWQGRVLP